MKSIALVAIVHVLSGCTTSITSKPKPGVKLIIAGVPGSGVIRGDTGKLGVEWCYVW